MMKNRVSLYAKGRPNKTWYKVKAHDTADVVIMGYTKGAGKYSEMIGAVIFGQMWRQEDGTYKLAKRGQCSGMTDEERMLFTSQGTQMLGRVMEIKYNGVVGKWGFRHPNFVCFRTDKSGAECTWDGQE